VLSEIALEGQDADCCHFDTIVAPERTWLQTFRSAS
jgi:hypothetical protein